MLEDALLAYFDLARRRALTDYRHSCILYALQAPYARKGSPMKKPELPRILRQREP
jgi:hypothetical protein